MHKICNICYNKIFIGIKQFNCIDSHLICYSCFYNSLNNICCICRRNSYIYNIYSCFDNKITITCNYIPLIMNEYYHLINYSYQNKTTIDNIIDLEKHKGLYPYIKGNILKKYIKCSLILLAISCILYNIDIKESTNTIIKCYTTIDGIRCNVISYKYVYWFINLMFFWTSLFCIVISIYLVNNSIINCNNDFKHMLIKKMKIR